MGVIDSDYRGEIQVGLCNLGNQPYTIRPEERIAQLVVTPVCLLPIEEVEVLDETGRGEGGFGSDVYKRQDNHRFIGHPSCVGFHKKRIYHLNRKTKAFGKKSQANKEKFRNAATMGTVYDLSLIHISTRSGTAPRPTAAWPLVWTAW